MVGPSNIQEKTKIRKKRDFGGNLCHVRHAPENSFQPWRIYPEEKNFANKWSTSPAGKSKTSTFPLFTEDK